MSTYSTGCKFAFATSFLLAAVAGLSGCSSNINPADQFQAELTCGMTRKDFDLSANSHDGIVLEASMLVQVSFNPATRLEQLFGYFEDGRLIAVDRSLIRHLPFGLYSWLDGSYPVLTCNGVS